jgi:hypothetical protein
VESIPELHESSAIMKYRLLGKSGADSDLHGLLTHRKTPAILIGTRNV